MNLREGFVIPKETFLGAYGCEFQLYCHVMGEFGPPKFLVYLALLKARPRFLGCVVCPKETEGTGVHFDCTELGVELGDMKIVVVRVVSTIIVDKMTD